jgi:membrane fusion protein, copper/silver efflux system
MEGGTILQLTNLSTLWVEAEVYATQLSRIPRGAIASIEIPGIYSSTGRIEFASPELENGSRINRLRITVNNPGNKLIPGMPAYIKVKTQQRNSLHLPSGAVIREKNGATVWLQSGKETFRSQMVKLGIESDGTVEILHGLKEGDVVVVSGSYLLHSEFVFKRGADPMAGHNH